jgi:transposase
MGRPYSQDLRERVVAAVDGGMSVYAAAPVFRVSVSYIYKALSRRTKTGETTASAELKTWLVSARQIEVSTGCLCLEAHRAAYLSRWIGAKP